MNTHTENVSPLNNNGSYKKWSWAACFGTWVFLFANKQYKMGMKFFLFFLVLNILYYAPWLGITDLPINYSSITSALKLVFLGFSIWLGARGREIVWESGVWSTEEIFLRKQKFVRKIVVAYFIVLVVISFVFFTFIMKPYVNNPDLLEQRVLSEVLSQVRKDYPGINEVDFQNGYKVGLREGVSSGRKTASTTVQSKSYQKGYQYGYMIACSDEYNQDVCFKQLLNSK